MTNTTFCRSREHHQFTKSEFWRWWPIVKHRFFFEKRGYLFCEGHIEEHAAAEDLSRRRRPYGKQAGLQKLGNTPLKRGQVTSKQPLKGNTTINSPSDR